MALADDLQMVCRASGAVWCALQAHNETWKGNIQSVNRGGVVVSVHGLRGFIPLSRLSPDRLRSIDRQEDQEGMPIWGKVVQVSRMR